MAVSQTTTNDGEASKLRKASVIKHYGDDISWGELEIRSVVRQYRFYASNGLLVNAIERDDYEIEELVARFDKVEEEYANY